MKNRVWYFELIESLGTPKKIFNNIVEPSDVYRYLTEDVIEETEVDRVPVIAIGAHDTA